jgi:hypothetical protein
VEPGEIAAIIFDLDGVLLDSESAWVEVKKQFTEESGGHWKESAEWDMLGMSSIEWSRYMHDELGVRLPPERISSEVADRLVQQYRRHLPLLPGAIEAVRTLAQHWPLGLASSSNRNVIDLVLEEAGLAASFTATVSSEQVERGKPATGSEACGLRRDRGLHQRDPLGACGGDDGDRGPKSGLPARAGRSVPRGAGPGLARGAQSRDGSLSGWRLTS